MMNIKHTIITIGLAIGVVSSAYAIPEFPMSFYGNITIDDTAAPVGTVIRAYNASSTLIGEVTVSEAGVYGYDSPVKQRLILKEATGTITFKFKTESKNAGVETTGTLVQDYASYTAGLTVKKDLTFKTAIAVPASGGGGGGSSSGGGGGGGGGGYIAPVTNVNAKVATNTVINTKVATNTSTSTNKIDSANIDTKDAKINIANTTKNNGNINSPIAETKFIKTLALGSKNNEVLAMQKLLVSQKLLPIGSDTGYFGPATQKALKAWQKKNKLQATGMAGPVTRDLLAKQSKK